MGGTSVVLPLPIRSVCVLADIRIASREPRQKHSPATTGNHNHPQPPTTTTTTTKRFSQGKCCKSHSQENLGGRHGWRTRQRRCTAYPWQPLRFSCVYHLQSYFEKQCFVVVVVVVFETGA